MHSHFSVSRVLRACKKFEEILLCPGFLQSTVFIPGDSHTDDGPKQSVRAFCEGLPEGGIRSNSSDCCTGIRSKLSCDLTSVQVTTSTASAPLMWQSVKIVGPLPQDKMFCADQLGLVCGFVLKQNKYMVQLLFLFNQTVILPCENITPIRRDDIASDSFQGFNRLSGSPKDIYDRRLESVFESDKFAPTFNRCCNTEAINRQGLGKLSNPAIDLEQIPEGNVQTRDDLSQLKLQQDRFGAEAKTGQHVGFDCARFSDTNLVSDLVIDADGTRYYRVDWPVGSEQMESDAREDSKRRLEHVLDQYEVLLDGNRKGQLRSPIVPYSLEHCKVGGIENREQCFARALHVRGELGVTGLLEFLVRQVIPSLEVAIRSLIAAMPFPHVECEVCSPDLCGQDSASKQKSVL